VLEQLALQRRMLLLQCTVTRLQVKQLLILIRLHLHDPGSTLITAPTQADQDHLPMGAWPPHDHRPPPGQAPDGTGAEVSHQPASCAGARQRAGSMPE